MKTTKTDKAVRNKHIEETSNNDIKKSYTKYCERVGLTDKTGAFISDTEDVVLQFPYKDCYLEGGQSKEDKDYTEVFYNEVLAKAEVERLLAPNAFCNVVKYYADKKEEHPDTFENDNLFIKGNNLAALSSLLERFRGAIKLIYIDPPYNTGDDGFSYNDNFNRSTWLTFMKNRLEIAKELLSEDGAIYVQLDFHQVHYAKVLMDEIFGESNFQREIIWRIGWLSGYKTNDNNWIRNHDTILFYSKNHKKMNFKKYFIPKEEFKKIANSKDKEKYYIEDVWNGNEYDDLNSIAIVSFAGETVSKLLNKDDKVKGQKSEKLIERIIKAHTDEGDYVLDFFGGTGTTAAAAMKMRRKFIICELLDKHADIMKRRLKKVMEGEQTGISKKNNWKGGSSYVYCELAKDENYKYLEKIANATKENINDLTYEIIKKAVIRNTDTETITKKLKELSLEDKKRALKQLTDKNYMYIKYSEMQDSKYSSLSKSDKAFTKSFYKGK